MCVCVCVCIFLHHKDTNLMNCLTLCDTMDHSPKAPVSMGFSRQEYWSGLPPAAPDKST